MVSACLMVVNTIQAEVSALGDDINSESAAYECTQVKIDEVDPTLLTRAERVKRMEMNLHDSIDSYATCMTSVQKNMAAGGDGNGKGNRGDGGSGSETSEAAVNQNSDGSLQTESEPSASDQNPELTSTSAQTIKQARGLIKPKDNDAIICRLLWDEIQKAPIDKKAGFEKQYAEYKCG